MTRVDEHYNRTYCQGQLDLTRYRNIITRPICLEEIFAKYKCTNDVSVHGFADDVRLVFTNAIRFNQEGSEVHQLASEFLRAFNYSYDSLDERYSISEADIDELMEELMEEEVESGGSGSFL